MLQCRSLQSFVVLFVGAFASSVLIADESERLSDFFERAFEDELTRNPVQQSYLGIKTNYGEWNDVSEGAIRREYVINTELLTTLRSEFDFRRLSESDQLSFRLFEYRCEQALADYAWRFHTYPVNQMFGAQSMVPAFLINIHRITSVKDAEAYISRLKGVRALMSQVISDIDRRRELGIVVPAFVIPYVLQDCENLLQGKTVHRSPSKTAPC